MESFEVRDICCVAYDEIGFCEDGFLTSIFRGRFPECGFLETVSESCS